MAADSTKLRMLIRLVIIILANGVAGLLGMLLAVPPGFASPIFPAAGVGLALLIGWGLRYWPGIFLGAVIFNTARGVVLDGVPFLAALPTSSIMAIGSTLQALLAVWFVRRFLSGTLRLDGPIDITKFLLLCGPVSCTVGATIGCLTLYLNGIIDGQAFFSSWVIWWMGDSLGVTVFTPLILVFVAKPEQLWRSRRWTVSAPICIAFLLSVIAFVYASHREEMIAKSQFGRQVDVTTAVLQERLDKQMEAIHALRGLANASNEVTREEFHRFCKEILVQLPELQALEWIPHVPRNEVQSLVETVRTQSDQHPESSTNDALANFVIKEWSEGSWVPETSTNGSAADLIWYIEPFTGNEAALGLNVRTLNQRRELTDYARDSGRIVATNGFRLAQETEDQFAVMVMIPVYNTDSVPDSIPSRRKHFEGMMAGVLRVGATVDHALQRISEHNLRLHVVDQSAPGTDEHVLHTSFPTTQNRHDQMLVESRQVLIGGRRWNLKYLPSGTIRTPFSTWEPWAVVFGSLLFTTLLQSFLLFVTGHTERTERIVATQTADLNRSNKQLESEITRRAEVEEKLREQATELKQSVEDLNEFAYAASHDLRSPLRAITHLVEWIRADEDSHLSAESIEYLELLDSRAVRMDNLLMSLLEYSRIGRKHYPLETFQVRDKLEQIRAIQTIPDGFQVEIDCHDPGLEITTQAVPFEQVVRNLIDNALKHHDLDAGQITLRTEDLVVRDGAEFLPLLVIDDGPGIPPEFRETVFKVFETLRSRDEVEGSGMGLSLVRKAVELKGGKVTIEGKAGRGTTFRILWPASESLESHPDVSSTHSRTVTDSANVNADPMHV